MPSQFHFPPHCLFLALGGLPVCTTHIWMFSRLYCLLITLHRRKSHKPLTETVLLAPTVEGDDSVTITPDVLAHRPTDRVAGSGSQEGHALFEPDPETQGGM